MLLGATPSRFDQALKTYWCEGQKREIKHTGIGHNSFKRKKHSEESVLVNDKMKG